jgi:L-alanine-DL-glutamate epimerase-like enolase superfamily enzyme
MATHNTGSLVCTLATVQWAASIRDYIACETITGRGGWMDQVAAGDQPPIRGGFIELNGKPGIGVELNPDIVKAHLAPGESWWG